MASVRVTFPREFESVSWSFFVAFGTAKGIAGDLRGILRKPDGTAFRGITLTPPPHWNIVFLNVDIGEGYTLELYDRDDTLLEFVDNLIAGGAGAGLVIASPLDNATVNSTYTANGTINPANGSVTGKMTLGTTPYNGVTRYPIPGNLSLWTIQFTGLPVGGGYTLEVTDQNGNNNNASNLRVVAQQGGGGS